MLFKVTDAAAHCGLLQINMIIYLCCWAWKLAIGLCVKRVPN